MSEPWPPPAPDASEAFRKANVNEKSDTAASNESKTVTQKDIEDLEKQRKRPVPVLKPTMPGVRTNDAQAERDKAAQLARLRQRLKESGTKAREDFNREAGRER